MKPLYISHAEDPDGIISLALKMRYYSSMGNPVAGQHIFVRYDRIVEAFQEAAAKVDGYDLVFVTDINPNPRLVKAGGAYFSLIERLAANKMVFWYDHHDGSQKHMDKLTEVGVSVNHDESQCAAMLIYKAQNQFLPSGTIPDPYERKLAKIAQPHDYKNTSSDHPNIKIGNELEKIIALANENLNYSLLFDLSCALQNEKCFNEDFNLLPSWQQYSTEFDRRSEEAYRELDHTVEITTTGDHKVLFGYSSPLLSQKPGSFHLRQKYQKNADVFVCLFKSPTRNHIVLKNENSNFPIISLLQSLGGGGRGNGGGFSLDYDITPQNYAAIKEMLLLEIDKISYSNK